MGKYCCPGCGKELTPEDSPNGHLSKWDFECKECGTLCNKDELNEKENISFRSGTLD